ncbi:MULTISPECIES: FmdB family zinc ribbon protein [unclassified Legionella]|uniref:FmdB family zinc ribbon protein n=1 Tax=unclassified Legionella TaxID=2622702 RepID=UPI001056B993|nr:MULTISPECIES: zinc ribbon domain-containing protein [unclassified Legionella]MDI9818793.1 zinc ribbon domain-containing protein [Legionella sp. PL877]
MPIYEYECKSCHHHFDLMQKISDTPAKQCPQCFEDKAVRLVSAAGFQLKGTGWYATDFKNKDTQKKTDTTEIKAGDKKAADSSPVKTETKGDKD